MNELIVPEIFNSSVKAFFTKKHIGVDIDKICRMYSIRKERVYLPIQRHTDIIQFISGDLSLKVADAVITADKGLLVGIKVADCVPILISDSKNAIVAAVHAGWRSTGSCILKKTIRFMIQYFRSEPVDIKIAFGPSIRWSCYCVGYEVKEAICKATGEGEYYSQRDGKYFIDLPTANMYQAISMGIPGKNIWISNECTYCNPGEFYSYRYDKSLKGKQGGFIGIF
ncbi:MAG: peptidoglycan editing factor PgeF [Thermodesulfovibrionales bacterium]